MKTYILFILIIGALGCAPANAPIDFRIPFTDQAIFKNADYIEVPFYTYDDNGKTYIVHGTSMDIIDYDGHERTDVMVSTIIDTISDQPVFAWEKTYAKNVMVAIFNERVVVNNEKQQIENSSSVIWAWNTGMSTGQEGAISYDDGCDVVDGDILYNEEPTPLVRGKGYVLAIWAWDDEANKVIYSSREIPFWVE